MIKIKNFISILSLMLIVLLLILNYRYPFIRNENLPWVVGYNSSEKFLDNLVINQKNIISSDLTKSFKIGKESRFLADPFFIIENDTTYIFVENQIEGEGAVIGLFKKYQDDIVYEGTILDPSFHISFPQVFKYENDFYMLPETKRSNNVLLYKSNSFPYDWTVVDTLIKNVRYKDPAILIMDSLNFIFTCNDDFELFVYCSDNVFEGWTECDNYKKKYGNEIRAGGRIFKHNQRYYLPMQNMNKAYGTSITLYEISISKEGVRLIRKNENFIKPQIGEKYFNSAMHHIDIQKHADKYIYYYDGQNLDKKKFNIRSSMAFNFYDFKSFILNF